MSGTSHINEYDSTIYQLDQLTLTFY